jgi:hypothetical protein
VKIVRVFDMSDAALLIFFRDCIAQASGDCCVIDAATCSDVEGGPPNSVMIIEKLFPTSLQGIMCLPNAERGAEAAASFPSSSCVPIREEELVAFCCELVQHGLALHNNIQPSNVMFETSTGGISKPVLVGFGFSWQERDVQRWSDCPQRLTGVRDGRNDVYSIAAVALYAVLGGQYPSDFASGGWVREMETGSLRDWKASGSPLHAVLKRCLSSDASVRPFPHEICAELSLMHQALVGGSEPIPVVSSEHLTRDERR